MRGEDRIVGSRITDAVYAPASFTQFVWTWNATQGLLTPGLHAEITGWLDDRWRVGDRRLLLLVFRSAGKSTLVGLFCAWLLLRDPNKRILVVSAEQALACKMTRNVRAIIERHPLTYHLAEGLKEQWAADQLTVRRERVHRDPSLLARGITGNITGSRADVIVCDDVEVPNTCDTPLKRAILRERLSELSYVLVPDGLRLFIGTPHTFDSIYASRTAGPASDGPFLDGFERLVLPVVDEQGRSRWPERFSTSALERIRADTGPAKFASQMLLEPRDLSEVRLDPQGLHFYEDELVASGAGSRTVWRIGERTMRSATCWWDPAYGRPGTGHGSVIAVVFVDEEGAFWLHDLDELTFDVDLTHEVDEVTQLCRRVVSFALRNGQTRIAVEINGIGRFLPASLRREIRSSGAEIRIIERVSSRSKIQRILDAFDMALATRRLRVHARLRDSCLIEEMRTWLPDRPCRDDALDAVANCLLEEQKSGLAALARASAGDGRWRAASWQAACDFAA